MLGFMTRLPAVPAFALALSALACRMTPHAPAMSSPTENSLLQPAEMVGFVVTTDGARARDFYVTRIGFRVIEEDELALVLDADGYMLRVQKMREHTARPYTVLGWNVPDLPATLTRLAAAGIACERFPGAPLDELGTMHFPDGTRLAWLKDPDGNVLSLAQMPPTKLPRGSRK